MLRAADVTDFIGQGTRRPLPVCVSWAAVALVDVAFLFAFAALLALAFPLTAWAYVDPSVMTYTIQALAGVAVALSAVLGVAWRRLRRMAMRALGVDENAGKVVEPVAHRIDPATASAVPNACDAVSLEKNGEVRRVSPPWATRFVLAGLASVLLSFTLFVAAPFEMVMGNSADLVLGLANVGPVMVGVALFAAVVFAIVLAVLPQRLFMASLSVVVAVGLCCFVQAAFLNAGLPAADGTPLVLSDHVLSCVVSAAVWLTIVVAAIVLGLTRQVALCILVPVLCICLVAVQAFGLVGMAMERSGDSASQQLFLTEDGLFDVSQKSNVVVFVLDTTDTMFVEKAYESNPHLFGEMTGFTWFTDSTGSLIPTRYGIPFLLTGKMPQPDQTFAEYYEDRYKDSSFVADIAKAGYSVGIYSDSLINGRPYLAGLVDNLTPIDAGQVASSGVMDVPGTVNALTRCALYRDLPWLVKPAFWFYTDWVNAGMVDGMAQVEDPSCLPYLIDDAVYAKKLRQSGLSVRERGEKGSFRFIHLLGSHPPYVIDENAEPLASGRGSEEVQTRGAFCIVGEYLRQLKALGVYDQTAVIVTADHGRWINSVKDAYWTSSPVMMVKPAGAANVSLATSAAQTGHVDFAATVMQAIGSEKASSYGCSVWDAPVSGRARAYCHLTHDHLINKDYDLEEFLITGDVMDFDNWELDGNRWPVTYP